MVKRFIHLLFLPCSEATLLLEKRNANSISRKEDWKLSMHLKICKWCKAYEKKLKILDEILKRKLFQDKKTEINDIDIQSFKDKMMNKFNL